jgi:enediyne polyketide synthase
VVRDLLLRRTELPGAQLPDDCRLLADLHLTSITVAQIAAEAAGILGTAPPPAPLDYARLTIGDLARVLDALASSPLPDASSAEPAGVASWIRAFTVDLTEERPRTGAAEACCWQVIAASDYPLKEAALRTFDRSGSHAGVVLCLPPHPGHQHLSLLLEAASALRQLPVPRRFLLVQHGGGAASFAKCLHLELAEVDTCVVDLPLSEEALEWARTEAEATTGFQEVFFDNSRGRRVPVLRLRSLSQGEAPLGPRDVVVVSGGGKGIGAECALSLARETGSRLAILGRSDPGDDAELAENLNRMLQAGVRHLYLRADVTDPGAVRAALQRVAIEAAPVTAILHGAGRNIPSLIENLDEEDLIAAQQTKLVGLRNLLAPLDETRLRLLVTFGSVIARTGLQGEGHYGLANEWMGRFVEDFAARFPRCRCLQIDWSVWSGVGMGVRLGGLESLMRAGVTPISVDWGTGMLRQLLASPELPASVVVTGRFGRLPTLKLEQGELPLLRFLERPLVHYPGIELVVDAEISLGSDPYLADHTLDGVGIFPAALGLEAMAQVAAAATGYGSAPAFAEVEFRRPITLPLEGARKIRLAALVEDPLTVSVVIRSEETGFQADHFSARCRLEPSELGASSLRAALGESERMLPLDPTADLYGPILFHGPRFHRLCGYRQLSARSCVAVVKVSPETVWFGEYSPSRLILGDPGARDAFVHALQACIPHRRVLPVSVERLVTRGCPEGMVSVYAKERCCTAESYTYDIEVCDQTGSVCERWEGLTLRVASEIPPPAAWPEPLLPPYLERRVGELVPGAPLSVALVSACSPSYQDRRSRSDTAIRQALGSPDVLRRRPDGKPELNGNRVVSASHLPHHTLAVAGIGSLACDLELVVERNQDLWEQLLGKDRFVLATLLSKETGEDLATGATRVWAAAECLTKAGCPASEPMTLADVSGDGWTQLRAGDLRVVTFATRLGSVEEPVVVAMVTRGIR